MARLYRIKSILLKLSVLTLTIGTGCLAQEKFNVQEYWVEHFDKYDATGTIVVIDNRQKHTKKLVFNHSRAEKRFSPASTYKLPHTLFALDAKLVKDEFQVFPWDGIKRNFTLHNQDQNLRSAMRNSAIWVYDIFAKNLGEVKARNYLKEIEYGNQDPSTNQNPSTKQGSYWVDGNLSISAYEQVKFLQRLYKNELPFRMEHQRLLKDIIITKAGKNWILRAKTGWEGRYGWWVGWVEWPTGPVFFALNIDTPNRIKDLFKRQAIVSDILTSIDALPSNK